MKQFQMTGVIHRISPARMVGGGKRLRDFALRWPFGDGHQVAEMVFTGDNTVTLDSYETGQIVEATFSIAGREWTNPKTGDTKIFTDLLCWGLELRDEHE